MTEEVKVRRRRRSSDGKDNEVRQQLMEGMVHTRAELNQAYAQFNLHSDPDLVDSCVYAINALRCRYSYLIRQIKLLDSETEEGEG